MSERRLLTKRLRRDVPPSRRSGVKTARRQDVWMRQQRSPEVCLLELAVSGTERFGRARTFARRSHPVVANLHKTLLRKEAAEITGRTSEEKRAICG